MSEAGQYINMGRYICQQPIIIILTYSMSRVKIKQELVYFPKNIRKNNLPKQQPQQQRPKTTSHPRYFSSKEYRYIPEYRSELDPALKTLQFNNTFYKKGGSPQRKNTYRFLQACRIEKTKESKIKYNTIEGKVKFSDQNNNMEDFVQALIDSNYFFQKLERTMVESLTLIGSQKKYQKGQKLDLPRKYIGFVLYGKVKMLSQDYVFICTRGDTMGEHQIFGVSKQFKLKVLENSAILWVSIPNYNILRQESVKEGFRHDFNKIDTQLRLSNIKKKIPKE